MSSQKVHVSPNDLLLNSYKLAQKVVDSGFRPNWLVALWRGGTPIGIAMQEYLEHARGISTDHIAIRTSSYKNGVQGDEIRVHNLHYIIENANAHDRILFVDDIFDSGRSIQAVLEKLKEKMRDNFPQYRIATIYWKPENNKTNLVPDFWMFETDRWIVFPHELEGLSKDEIRDFKGHEIATFIENS